MLITYKVWNLGHNRFWETAFTKKIKFFLFFRERKIPKIGVVSSSCVNHYWTSQSLSCADENELKTCSNLWWWRTKRWHCYSSWHHSRHHSRRPHHWHHAHHAYIDAHTHHSTYSSVYMQSCNTQSLYMIQHWTYLLFTHFVLLVLNVYRTRDYG